MQPQFILRIAGIVALVIAALFALLAIQYYLSQNIRAVMDDLSGKKRARGVARRGSTDAGGRRPGASRPSGGEAGAPVRKAQVESAVQMPAFADEEDLGTSLSSPMHGAEAPLPAVAEQAADVAQASLTKENSAPAFRLTRSVVLIHAQEVIVANEEQLA